MEIKRAIKRLNWSGNIGLLAAFLCLAALTPASSQGWQVSFGGNGEDQGQALIQTVDHGYVLVGFSESFGPDNDLDVYIVRTDVDGRLVWSQTYDDGFVEHGYDVIETADNGILVVGDIYNSAQDFPSDANVYLLRLDKRGQVLWSRQFGGASFEQALAVCQAPDGGFAILGRTKESSNGRDDILLIRVDDQGNEIWTRTYGGLGDDRGTSIVPLGSGFAFTGFASNSVGGIGNDIVLYRVDAQGEVIWNEVFGTSGNEEAHDLVVTAGDSLVLAGSINNYNDAFLAKYSPEGELSWTKSIGYGTLGDEALSIIVLPDQSLVIAGRTETNAMNTDVLLAKLNKDGILIWIRALGDPNFLDTAEGLVATKAGGFAMVGYNALETVFFNDLTLMVADGNGNTITNTIKGKVFRDQGNCQLDATDVPLSGWIVKAQSATRTYFGVTDSQGNYSMLTASGNYQVSVIPKVADYWQSCVPGGYVVNLNVPYDTSNLNFPIFPVVSCPWLEVSVSAPYLQYCNEVNYTVSYRNEGTALASDAVIEVVLGDHLEFVSSSIPGTIVDNKVVFAIGDVEASGSGTFTFQAAVACDGVLTGAASLVNTTILPHTPCLPPNPSWDGASVVVSAQCEPDSIRFQIRNEGAGDMDNPGDYIIIEDQILLFQEPFQLDAGESQQFTVPASGKTYRLIAEQSPLHPGRSFPTVAVEGCTNMGNYSTGQVTQFPEDDQDAFVDIDVQEIIDFDSLPAALRGYPKGYGDSSLIAPTTDLTYLLLFENPGTDTINRIVIRDTLSSALDPASIIPGASSHPYHWEVMGNGVLRITMEDVELLPEGSAHSESQGFIQFRISQKPGNPVGTLITNRAAFYFDYYAPQLTSTVTHRVGNFPNFIAVSTDEPGNLPGVIINAFPNPFTEVAVFQIEGLDINGGEFQIYDGLGRKMESLNFFGNRFEYRHNRRLAQGIYYFLIQSEGRLVGSGKIQVR